MTPPRAGLSRHFGGVRILHVTDCYLPRLGGIEVQVDELSRAQQAAGHEVAIATATPCEAADPGGAGVHRLVAPLPWELPLGRSVAGVLGLRKPDVVHVHAGAVSPFAWRAVRRAARAGLPTVLTVHSLWGPLSCALYRGLFARWARYEGLVVTTVSEAAAVPIRQVVAGRLPVRVVSNGIETAHWRSLPAEAERGQGPAVHIVAVGRLAPRKEPLTLLRLLRDVAGRAPIRATIVGDGPARARMERYLRRHGMRDLVRLTGRLDRSAVRTVLAGADIFLAPASRESFGLAPLEARLAGVPVVAQAGSGVADFVASGREGLLGETFTEMATALLRLATDRDLRHRIAVHNRATTPRGCTWPAVLGAFERCYELAALPRTERAHL